MKTLINKVVVVTGGSGLLGTAICKDLINKGAIVINADLNLNQSNCCESISCDITDKTSVEKAVNSILIKHGKINGWVNNAYPRTKDWGKKFEEIELESWKKNIDMQLNSVFITSQVVLEIMKKQEFGSIVNIASIYGIIGPNFTIYEGQEMTMPAAYSAIKGGIINFTRYLASYYGNYNLRVNCVSPGGIQDNQHSLFVEKYQNNVPLKRMGKPDDIAPAVSFLLSDDSKYITGQNLVIDGGLSII